MAKEQNNARWLQILVGILASIAFSMSSWTVLKAVELDKELATLKAENAANHVAFAKEDSTMIREQRIMSRKIDKVSTTVIKIATKLEIDTP